VEILHSRGCLRVSGFVNHAESTDSPDPVQTPAIIANVEIAPQNGINVIAAVGGKRLH